MTPDQIQAFQRGPLAGPRPVDFYGVPLLVDGALGDKTRWAMDIATLPTWRQNQVRSVVSMHGRREEGVNRGAWLDPMFAICRLDPDVDGDGPSEDGHPWCAVFASYHLAQHSPYPFVPDASVARLIRNLHPVAHDRAQPGDLAAALRADGTGHVGTLIARGGGWSASCDGNLGNMVRTVRYPVHDRQYFSVEPQLLCPLVAMGIPLYTGSTR